MALRAFSVRLVKCGSRRLRLHQPLGKILSAVLDDGLSGALEIGNGLFVHIAQLTHEKNVQRRIHLVQQVVTFALIDFGVISACFMTECVCREMN